MQGKLSEIDIRSILQLIELGQRTGELCVEAYLPSESHRSEREVATLTDLPLAPPTCRSWLIFFFNGRIVYATNTVNSLSRLKDYLRRYQTEPVLTRLMADPSALLNAFEYDCLWFLLENHILTPAQSRSIINSMVHETLFDLFDLHQGSFIFATGSALSPQLTTLEVTPHLTRTAKQVQQWKQLHPYIQSPEQVLLIADVTRLQALLSHRTFNKFSGFVDGKTSIRQIARYLNRDILTVARAIYPYIQQGVIQLSQSGLRELRSGMDGTTISSCSYPTPSTQRPTVVYVGDEVSDREAIPVILSLHGYSVTVIANPVDALSLLFRLHPDLILCDITTPDLDGYEMCRMLRQSTAFRYTPIVMLTNKNSFLDRVQGRLVGATDYLIKPFGESEILMLVEKYAGLGYSEQSQSVTLLADRSDDRLQIDRTDASSISSTPLN